MSSYNSCTVYNSVVHFVVNVHKNIHEINNIKSPEMFTSITTKLSMLHPKELPPETTICIPYAFKKFPYSNTRQTGSRVIVSDKHSSL